MDVQLFRADVRLSTLTEAQASYDVISFRGSLPLRETCTFTVCRWGKHPINLIQRYSFSGF